MKRGTGRTVLASGAWGKTRKMHVPWREQLMLGMLGRGCWSVAVIGLELLYLESIVMDAARRPNG